MEELLTNRYIVGMITGLVSAAAVDFMAFRSWKNFDEAKAYSWNIAVWRWFQGVVSGLLTAAGIAGLS